MLGDLPEFKSTGEIPIFYLKRYWQKTLWKKRGNWPKILNQENVLDKPLFDSLGLPIQPTLEFLFHMEPSFEEFESWIHENGHIATRPHLIEQFNRLFQTDNSQSSVGACVFSEKEIQFFKDQGYMVLKNALSKEECQETVDLICELLCANLSDQRTWYNINSLRSGIMINYFQNEILERNRLKPRIREAYEQLWQSDLLWPSTDRIGFHPPQTASWPFPGPFLHLDIEPTTPLPFGLQGILYLADTAEDQGAFSLIPKFHHVLLL